MVISILGFFSFSVVLEVLLIHFFSFAQVFFACATLSFHYLLKKDVILVILACLSNHIFNTVLNRRNFLPSELGWSLFLASSVFAQIYFLFASALGLTFVFPFSVPELFPLAPPSQTETISAIFPSPPLDFQCVVVRLVDLGNLACQVV